jgi:hypothetical protein
VLTTGAIGSYWRWLGSPETGRMEETAKVMMAFAVWFGIVMAELIRKSDVEPALGTFCGLYVHSYTKK